MHATTHFYCSPSLPHPPLQKKSLLTGTKYMYNTFFQSMPTRTLTKLYPCLVPPPQKMWQQVK